MKFGAYEDIVHITESWTGERMPDGRPKVSDDILNRMKKLTIEEIHFSLWQAGYKYQFEGHWKTSRPGEKLVGRAVTATMVPKRPDLDTTLINYGRNEEGRKGSMNQWVIDSLVEGDVAVVDMYDKIFGGTFVGGNLTTAVASRTKGGGAVIWGGVRDLEQMIDIPAQVYYRDTDPTGIKDTTLVRLNGPCLIGGAVCLPGDVVFGTMAGVLFVPPHMAEYCVVRAEKAHVRDIFGFLRLDDGTYTTAQIDTAWTTAIMEDFLEWIKTDPQGEEYRHLTWEEELEAAKQKDANPDAPPEVRA